MGLDRTEPDFVDPDRTHFSYTFSMRSLGSDDSGTAVEYLLTGSSPGSVYAASGASSSAGNFINFVYEGEITGEYNLTGTIRDLGGNDIDPADLLISSNGSDPSPSSLLELPPTAFVDHLAPRPLATTLRLAGATSSPGDGETFAIGEVFVFTIAFHEELSLVNYGDALSNLQLDLDFDVESSDRSIPLSSIPSSEPSQLHFSYTISDGDQALVNDQTLGLHGLSKVGAFNTLALVDAHGNQVDPESIDFAYYDLDGDGSVLDDNGDGLVSLDGQGNLIDEEFDILQPDPAIHVDGVRPYWLSISSSSSYDDNGVEVNRSRPYTLSAGEDITFTLTASEALNGSENSMQLLLDLHPESSALGVQQSLGILGDFFGKSSSDSSDDNYSVLTFTHTVSDTLALDHLAIMASSSYQSGPGYITADRNGNPLLESNFSLLEDFIVFPSDEGLSSNQVKFDTIPPVVEAVSISGFDVNNLAITNTRISFTLHFADDDLDTASINAQSSEINLTLLDLRTDYDNSSSTDANLTLQQINADSLVFAGALPERVDWSGTFALQISGATTLITDKADPANGMVSELILGSGADDLNQTYVIDTAPPRIANLYEIDTDINTPISAIGDGYGPGRQATFMVTFNEELASIGGSQSTTAKLQFFVYDDEAGVGNKARDLRLRTATASGGSAELSSVVDADGNERSVAYFYYTVNEEDNASSANYDGGSVYLNYADTSSDPTTNAGDNYYRCFDGSNIVGTSGVTDCYFALDAQLKDANNNSATFTVSDSADWVYAFNRSNIDPIAPLEITRFVTDPLEIIGYSIRVSLTGSDRAWGYDHTSINNGSATEGNASINLNSAQPYIGASEAETESGGKIYFVIEPGAEDFAMNAATAEDVNLTFSIADAQDAEYVASYYATQASSSEYITFEFDIGDFKADYNSTIILHSVSQNAGMTYSDSSSVYVLADTRFYPSADLDATYPVENQQFDTGLLLDMQKPELLSVVAYRDVDPSDSNVSSEAFSVPIDTTVDSDPYFGRDDQVVFRFSFSENLGGVSPSGSNSLIYLSLELDSGTIFAEQASSIQDDRSIASDDFSTFDVTYTVGDKHAGGVNNDHFVLDAIVTDQNGNYITGSDLNISRLVSGFVSPQVSGDYPELDAVNIYRRVNLSSADSEVYNPIPDIANNISDYTLIGGDDLYIAATFTYTLDALADHYPDFQEYDHDGDLDTAASIEANYSFSSQIPGTSLFIAEYAAAFSDSDLSIDGANVLLFSYEINATNDPADSGTNTLLLDDLIGLGNVDQIYDIYGNPTSSFMPTEASTTVTSIDSTAPELIDVNHVVATGQSVNKVNYGPLDSNISFALTFDEVIDLEESFSTLQLTFYIGDDSSGTAIYSPRTLRQGTSIALLEAAEPEPLSGYEQGQIVNMVYYLDSNDYGTIDVNASATDGGTTSYYPMRLSGNIYDHHNGARGNGTLIGQEVNNSNDANADFYIPELTINRTAIDPERWSIEARSSSTNQAFIPHGSSRSDGVIWESNASSSVRVGIDNTLSFIIDYPTAIEINSLYSDSDTTGSSPTSIIDPDNNVTLLFTSRSYDLVFAAPIFNVVDDPDPSINSTSLIFTYAIEEDLGLELDNLSFESIAIPSGTKIRSSAFNEIIISGTAFDQSTNVTIDAIYPQISNIDVYVASGDAGAVYSDNSSNRKYFGEDDNITFRVTFSEELIDDNTSDATPDFDLSWTILDDAEGGMQYFSSGSTTTAEINASHNSNNRVYNLVFPIDLASDSQLTADPYQGLIQFSASSPTQVFTASAGVIADLAQNSRQNFTYTVDSDRNASTNNNYAVDFIRPRLQYIDSAGSGSNVSSLSYTEYDGIGGDALTHYYGALDLSFYVVHDSALAIASGTQPVLGLSVPSTSGSTDFNLSLSSNSSSATTWPTLAAGGTTNENALAFKLASSDAQTALSAGASFDGVVTFSTILSATSYSDKSGNYAYFELVDNSNAIEYVYGDGNLSLGVGGYIPSVADLDNHAYPAPTIYLDTTPPTFSIANQQDIELTNRALVFELTLDKPLSDLESSNSFNRDSNTSYHSAPTYKLSWENSKGGSDSYSGQLYDGSDGSAPFTFTLFTDSGSTTLAGDPDAAADYATYLDDLADNSTHTFTMTLSDFVGNSSSVEFEVNKTTDEFLGYITGWDGDNNQSYNSDSDEGVELDDANASAIFLVSFITAINESTLDAKDFAITYSDGATDDIAGLTISSNGIVENTITAAANDYLITVSGGNLALAAGAFTLAFDDSPDIRTADGGASFDPSILAEANKSFSYSKSFSFGIDAIAQPNHDNPDPGATPDIEINFTAPDVSQSALSIDGYKLYHSLDGSDPDSDSPYFSSLEHPGLFTSANLAAQRSSLIPACPILGATSQSYSFRVVAQYEVDGDFYETHIDRGSTVSIELNATLPTYTSNTTDLNLPYCDSSTLAAADCRYHQ